MRFNGISWKQIGLNGFSAPTVEQPTIATDSSGTPFAAYAQNADFTTIYTMHIMKFNGTDWIPAGPNGSVNLSPGGVFPVGTALIAGPSNKIYAGFSDMPNGNKVTVMVLGL